MLSQESVQPMLPVRDLDVAAGFYEKTHEAGTLKVAWFKDPGGNILSIQNKPPRQRER